MAYLHYVTYQPYIFLFPFSALIVEYLLIYLASHSASIPVVSDLLG